MSDEKSKIDFVDLTAPEKKEEPVERKPLDKDAAVEQLSHIIFTDCGRAGVLFGLDTDSVSVALLSAAETMLWFSQKAGKIDDEGAEELRKKAAELTTKRKEYFKESGLEGLIEQAGKVAKHNKERCCGACSSEEEDKCEEENDE